MLWQTGYRYFGGRLLATMSGAAGSGTRFHHPDRLGTRIVTDQSNAELVTVQAGMPFGTRLHLRQAGRLTEMWGGADPVNNATWWHYYGYDRYGNRTWASKEGPGRDSKPLDAIANIHAHLNYFEFADGSQQYKTLSNRIMTAGYEYDPAGNLMAGQSEGGVWQQYRYDAAGRLVEVWNGGGTALLESHGYGAGNARLLTEQGGTTTYYGWDGGQIVAEYTAAGTNSLNWAKSYVYLGGRLLATQKVGLPAQDTTQFHHPDRLGTRLVTNGADGAIVSEQVGMPYGTMLANGALHGEGSYQDPGMNRANQSQKRFTSYDRSQTTGLDYAVNRYYNAAQGRFTQVDPIGASASSLTDPQTLNLYSYCANDPINHVDPDGLFFGKLFGWINKVFKAVAIAILVAGAILLTSGLAVAAIAWSLQAGAAFFKAFGALMGFFQSHKVIAGIVGIGSVGGLRTPSFNGAGVSGVSNFLQQSGDNGRPRISIWDAIQTGLDFVGLIPAFGEIADGCNALISLGRGDKTGALLSAGAMVPFAGWGATAGKFGRRALKYTKKAGPPLRDATGKVHGQLPDFVPDNWSRGEIEDTIQELKGSIDARKVEQRRLGEDGPHRDRIRQEERLLRQCQKKLGGS